MITSPTDGQLVSMGLASLGAGDSGEAVRRFRQAVAIAPTSIAAIGNLANAEADAGRSASACARYRRGLGVAPTLPALHLMLGTALLRAGDEAHGRASMARAIELNPGYPKAYGNLGSYELSRCRAVEAERHFRSALQGDRAYVPALVGLVRALGAQGVTEGTMVLARRGVCIEPASVDTSLAVAQAEFSYGHLGDTYRWYLRAKAIEAGEGVSKWAMLFLHYRPETSSRELFDLHCRWGRGRPRVPAMDWSRKGRRADRPLRIGYVSADLFDHPVGRNVVGLLENHDRSAVEVVVYAARDEDDDVGRRCRAAAHSWRAIANLDDIAAAELMRSDEVDILVFLAGHTFANRISVAAHRAAPVQVSMHDLTTSGLDEMDWFISDGTLSPTDGDELFTEKVARLPCFYLHMPLDDLPTTSRDGDGIVLGSCSNPAKLNDEVVATWAEILRRRPEAELRLKYRGAFSDPRLVSDLQRRFRQLEVEPSRVILDVRRTGRRDHLAFVGEFDVALDTFPFNGSTTTYEALWMGVPVVTLVGRRFVGRVGAAMLGLVGLEDLIAEDRRSYVDKVLCLTEDKDRRMELRRHLRERLKASPLLDAGAYARSVEGAYRAMWRSWCEGRDMTAPQNRTSASS